MQTPGFAIRLDEKTELESGMLIAEDDAGSYLPIGPVSTIAEAREIAQDDLRLREHELDLGGSPFCPAVYRVWARGLKSFAVAAELDLVGL